MKIVSIISQKGGSGKTTLALHLAVAFQQTGKQTAVIDLDPQASSAKWGDSRESDTPVVISAQTTRLDKVLQVAREEGAEVVILDTAPHSESSAIAVMRVADVVLIPCRPAILDLRAVNDTIELVKLTKNSAYVVLNAVPPRGSWSQDAQEVVAQYGIDVAPANLGNRAAFSSSLLNGEVAQEYEPSGKAAREITKLYKWLNSLLWD